MSGVRFANKAKVMTRGAKPSRSGFLHSTGGHLFVAVSFLAAVATIAAFVVDLTGSNGGRNRPLGDPPRADTATPGRTVSSQPTSSPTATARPRATVAAWVQEMNAVCGTAKERAAARGPSPQDYEGAIEYLNTTATEWRQLQGAARTLAVPRAARRRVLEMLQLWSQAGDHFSQLAVDVANNDEQRFNEHRSLGQAQARQGSEIAVSLGAYECHGVS